MDIGAAAVCHLRPGSQLKRRRRADLRHHTRPGAAGQRHHDHDRRGDADRGRPRSARARMLPAALAVPLLGTLGPVGKWIASWNSTSSSTPPRLRPGKAV
jgi:hypothetical protein